MRIIRLIIVHCSATRSDRPFTVDALHRAHKARGWKGVGYHFYVTREGFVHVCRPLSVVGAHAKGYNAHSIGICYEGGLNPEGKPADTRTEAQKKSLRKLIELLRALLPKVNVKGHRDLPGVSKSCPCFDAEKEYGNL